MPSIQSCPLVPFFPYWYIVIAFFFVICAYLKGYFLHLQQVFVKYYGYLLIILPNKT
jgi:hypothetical protein